jgi:hypothetical protein
LGFKGSYGLGDQKFLFPSGKGMVSLQWLLPPTVNVLPNNTTFQRQFFNLGLKTEADSKGNFSLSYKNIDKF